MHHQTPFFTASTQQKGRPRKRKPLPVQHGQTDDNIIITTPGSHDHLSHEGALRLGEISLLYHTTLEHVFHYF